MTICQNRPGSTWTSSVASACCTPRWPSSARTATPAAASTSSRARPASRRARCSSTSTTSSTSSPTSPNRPRSDLRRDGAVSHAGAARTTVPRPPRRSGRHLDGLHGHASARARRHGGDDDGTRPRRPPRGSRARAPALRAGAASAARAAIEAGDLRADADVDALLSMLVLLLPHLALAPFEPGLDAGLALHGTSGAERSRRARRLLATHRSRRRWCASVTRPSTTTSSSSARASAAASARCGWSRRATRSRCSRPAGASPTTSSPRRRGTCATTCSRRALGCFGIFRMTPLRHALVLTGAGVGGGSLGYANTLYQPHDDVFADVARRAPTNWRRTTTRRAGCSASRPTRARHPPTA